MGGATDETDRQAVFRSVRLSVCDGREIDLLPAENNPAFLEFIFA